MSAVKNRAVLTGTMALTAAILLLVAAFARALTTDVPQIASAPVATAAAPEVPQATRPADEGPREGSPSTVPRADGGQAARAGSPLGMEALALAVENDPFQQDRRRPAQRYVLPSERVTYEAPPEPPPPPPFRVIGTALSAAGGLAVIQVEQMTPRVVALGEAMAGYTLESVDGESATLVGDGRTLTLPVTPAPEELPPQRRQRPGQRGRGAQNNDARERQVDVLEAIRRQMAERGGVPQDIQIENGRVIIRPRVNRDTLDMRQPRVP